MHITLRSQADPDTVLTEGEDTVLIDSVLVWWVSPNPPGEEQYTFRDVGVTIEGGMYYLSYTDDTDRNPRRIGQPAGIVHRLERDFASPVAGPFLVIIE